MRPVVAIVVALLLVMVAVPASAQRDSIRSLQGVVTDGSGTPLEGAVVQLKDTKTLQIRSFITRADGKYLFNGLSTEVDYEIKAVHKGKSSDSKRLSSFDGRKQAVIDLKVG